MGSNILNEHLFILLSLSLSLSILTVCACYLHLYVVAMVFAIGISSGVIENFAYQRLKELGGGGGVIGVNRLVSSFAGTQYNMYYTILVPSLDQ